MSSSQLQGLLAACKDDPTSDEPRLILADWFEEQGEADRAEFIRLQLREGPTYEDWYPTWAEDQARQDRLLRQHASDWFGASYASHSCCEWRRALSDGANSEVLEPRCQRGLLHLSASDRVARRIKSEIPPPALDWLEGLRLDGTGRDANALLRAPVVARFTDLTLSWGRPQPAAVANLLAQGHVRRFCLLLDQSDSLLSTLAELPEFQPHELRLERIGSGEGFETLAASPIFTEVRRLSCQPGHRGAALAALARADHLSKLEKLFLIDDNLALKHLRTLFDSPVALRLSDLVVGGYGEAGNPAAARAVAQGRALTGVKELNLGRNPISDDDAEALARSTVLGQLSSLKVTWCQLTADGALCLVTSPLAAGLEELNLSFNEFGDQVASALALSPIPRRLRRLDLCRCGLTDAGVEALANSPHLASVQELDLSANPIGDQALRALAASNYFGALRSLSLRQVRATPSAWRDLFRSPVVGRLLRLDLYEVPLGPVGAKAVADSHLSGLRELVMGNNGLGRLGAKTLGNAAWLGGLVRLSVASNKLDDEGLAALLRGLSRSELARLELIQNDLGNAAARALLDWPGLPDLVEVGLSGNAIDKELEERITRVVRTGVV